MNVDRHHYCFAVVSFEALSAHGIHSGQGDLTHDVLLVRDANGLPALPGTTIAGVLRHAYEHEYKQQQADQLFGQGGDKGSVSWLQVGWGQVHDSANRPVDADALVSEQDPLLNWLRQDKPLVRQRVRLNQRGAAADTGKFDVTLIPAGARYTTFISYWCDGSDSSRRHWQQLLALLTRPGLAFGHGTRSGVGQFKVCALSKMEWNLKTPEGREGYANRPRRRSQDSTLPAHQPTQTAKPLPSLTLKLKAEGGWRVGGNAEPLGDHYSKAPQLVPLHERCISWANNRGSISERMALLPGTAVKGALRHRVAYHYRCLEGNFVVDQPEEPEACAAVKALFGCAGDGDEGNAGVLQFSDLMLSQDVIRPQELHHNRIDRFTGGVMDGALFSEEVLWQTPLSLEIRLLPTRQTIDANARKALALALDDLAKGWLPLGAGGSRGLGTFIAEPDGVRWSDDGAWLHTTDQGVTA